MFYFVIFFVFLAIFGILLKKFLKIHNYWEKRGVKSIPYSFLQTFLGSKSVGDMDKEAYFTASKGENCAGVNDFVTGPTLLVKDLELAKKIMVKDFEHFSRRGFTTDQTGENVSSLMLINQSGANWKSMRSTLSPIFTTGKIKRLFYTFDKCADDLDEFVRRMLKENENKGESSNVIEIQNLFQRFTMGVIARAVFAVDSQSFSDIKEDPYFLKMAKRLTAFNLSMVWKFALAFIAPSLIDYFKISLFDSKADEYFEKVIGDSIKLRKNLGKNQKFNDFLELMLESKNNKEDPEENEETLDNFEKEAEIKNVKGKMELDDKTIHAQCLLFFFAGFDTTETALTWTIYELGVNNDIQQKLRQEIDSIYEKNDGKLDFDSLTNNGLLNNILNESLRKYPPATSTDRKCVKDYYAEELNMTIEKDVLISIPIYGFHHDPKYFPNPEKFDPSRFDTEEKEKRHPYAFMPFGHGPRNCIGMRFALQESKILLAHLIRNFYIEPCKETVIPPKWSNKSFSLKPENGMKLGFIPRHDI